MNLLARSYRHTEVRKTFILWSTSATVASFTTVAVALARQKLHAFEKKKEPVMLPKSRTFQEFKWINKFTPGFSVCGDSITVIKHPIDFYKTLLSEIQRANNRIVLSSLYLGNGKEEKKLVKALDETLSNKPKLHVHILLDYTRASRGKDNSRTILLPLIKKYGDRVKVSLYHTPKLRGLLKSLLPERWNEGIGVQHMKIYSCDNNVIMSGANLSDIYFDKRQDRYFLMKEVPHLVDYLEDLVNVVSTFSFQLGVANDIYLSKGLKSHPFRDHDGGDAFREEAHKLVCQFINDKKNTLAQSSEKTDTWIFPLLQMAQLGIDLDSQITTELLCKAHPETRLSLATGYFNLTDHYKNVIVKDSVAKYDILTAHPNANGFLNAAGPAGGIPYAYTHIIQQFFRQVQKAGQLNRVHLLEYQRPEWTFHGKGLWCYLPGDKLPCFTFIGSSNYGYRSTHRDLELQLAIVTDNRDLQSQLNEERNYLYESAEVVRANTFQEEKRLVPLWVKFVTGFIKSYF